MRHVVCSEIKERAKKTKADKAAQRSAAAKSTSKAAKNVPRGAAAPKGAGGKR